VGLNKPHQSLTIKGGNEYGKKKESKESRSSQESLAHPKEEVWQRWGERLMPKSLKFYNVKTKKSFTTSTYRTTTRKGRKFAVAKNAGIECWRILGKA